MCNEMTGVRKFTIGMLIRSYVINFLVNKVLEDIIRVCGRYCDNRCSNDDQCNHGIRQLYVVLHFGTAYVRTIHRLSDTLTLRYFILRAERHVAEYAANKGLHLCAGCLHDETSPTRIRSLVEDCRVAEAVFQRIAAQVPTSRTQQSFNVWPST